MPEFGCVHDAGKPDRARAINEACSTDEGEIAMDCLGRRASDLVDVELDTEKFMV